MRRHFLLKVIAVAAAFFASCSSLQPVSERGNGSETIAKVHGMVFLPGGAPAESARVVLLRSGYNPLTDMPPTGDSATYSDSHGRYTLPAALDSSASYNLEIRSAQERLSLAHSHISGRSQTLSFLNDTLAPPGAVTIALPANLPSGTLFMPGSTRSVKVSPEDRARGYCLFDSIMGGTTAPVAFAPGDAKGPSQILQSQVTVVANATTICRNLVIYSDTQSIITDTTVWVNCCSFAQDSASPAFEGKLSYRFDYVLNNYYAGAGMNLDNWGRQPMWDFSGCRSIRFAYRGLKPGNLMHIALTDADSSKADIQLKWGPLDSFTVEDVPLTSFLNVKPEINLHKIFEIDFGVSSGQPTDSGIVWIDDVEVIR